MRVRPLAAVTHPERVLVHNLALASGPLEAQTRHEGEGLEELVRRLGRRVDAAAPLLVERERSLKVACLKGLGRVEALDVAVTAQHQHAGPRRHGKGRPALAHSLRAAVEVGIREQRLRRALPGLLRDLEHIEAAHC